MFIAVVYGSAWFLIFKFVYVWMFMDVYGCLWMFMDVYDCLWMFVDVYGYEGSFLLCDDKFKPT